MTRDGCACWRTRLSIRALKWAWHQPLPTTEKFVLLALADVADDVGICWPSIATIAERCAMSPRTVRRALRELISVVLIQSHSRHRGDGSTTSNRYCLNLGGDDPVSGAPVTEAPQEGRQDQRGPVTKVPPRTTTRTIIDPTPPPDTEPTVAEVRGGELRKLIFPSNLTPAECAEATRRLDRFPTILAQQLLDELNGRLRRGGIKTTPLAYLGGLINRARAGTFVPEVGPSSAQPSSYRSQFRTETRALSTESSWEPGPVYLDVMTNPLCRRVGEIQIKRAQRRMATTPTITAPERVQRRDPSDESIAMSTTIEPLRACPKFPELARVIGG